MGSVDNIVAAGTVFKRQWSNEVVYGVTLGVNEVRVLIEVVDDTNSILPISVVGSVYSVSDAIGSYVPWPKHLVVVEKAEKVNFIYETMTYFICMFHFNV